MAAIQAKICAALILAALSGVAEAQFHTLHRKDFIGYEILKTNENELSNSVIQSVGAVPDSTAQHIHVPKDIHEYDSKRSEKCGVRKKHLEFNPANDACNDGATLPELTIANLLAEIRRNGICHEKVVLAQAILETGWFTSSVCRYKNNLFGLTNPRSGQYYEFSHWTESVRAYRDKVQYRYKEGNYLLWLKEIGYAEDPRYVSSLIRILRQYML